MEVLQHEHVEQLLRLLLEAGQPRQCRHRCRQLGAHLQHMTAALTRRSAALIAHERHFS